jgi:NAD-dependent dihydropyrimidine dehydrogenase PreA subunit
MGMLDAPQRHALSFKGHLKAWAHGGRQVLASAPRSCAGCGECVRVCPEQALTLTRRPPAQDPGHA